MKTENKQAELDKYRDLIIATIDYLMQNPVLKIKTESFDSEKYFEELKIINMQDYNKGKLSVLKQGFNDLTESMRETEDFKFIQYIKQTTGYDIDIFAAFKKRVEKIITNGRIKTEQQYREVMSMIEFLLQSENKNKEKIETLNTLAKDYDALTIKKHMKKGKPQ